MSAWTPDRLKRLCHLAACGFMGKEIADMLVSSRGSVHRQLRLLGVRLNYSNRGRRACGTPPASAPPSSPPTPATDREAAQAEGPAQ